MIDRPLFAHAWRMQRVKLAAVCLGLVIWGFITPVVYAQFGAQLRVLFDNGLIPEQFAQFGGGDIFSLPGAMALGFIHPISLILQSVFAVGYSAAAVAGERQRGTLEVTLARPISRRTLYGTLFVAAFTFLAATTTALIAGSVSGAMFEGVQRELAIDALPLLWLNGVLLFAAIASIGLAASISFDRFAPALGLTLSVVVISYFLEVLGSLWPDARPLQPYSLFHYLQPRAILMGHGAASDVGVLAMIVALAVTYALIVFPRRDLPAPS
jgi:ABC-2 type transport system permease protein